MKLDFDVTNATTTEFGVGQDEKRQPYTLVPADAKVQVSLRQMVTSTWAGMQRQEDDPSRYEPSEQYGSVAYVYLPIGDDLAETVRQLHEANNLTMDAAALSNPSLIFCYFARMTDARGHHLTALRRAAQFKGVLKSRLIRLATDALTLIEDKVFKLDTDFDMLIDDTNVHILRPSGFEFVGELQSAVLAAAPKNIKAIQRDLPFVDFARIQEYASKHPRAARYLASIRSQKEATNIEKVALKRLCKATGVEIHEKDGKLVVQEGHFMAFLEVLDRRRYQLELVKDSPESFRAVSRRKLASSGVGGT